MLPPGDGVSKGEHMHCNASSMQRSPHRAIIASIYCNPLLQATSLASDNVLCWCDSIFRTILTLRVHLDPTQSRFYRAMQRNSLRGQHELLRNPPGP
ncbi:hypothetical protein IG631_05364 [Alternaria alternata]|nr:hypothetical protein IG631_05364 [Alternaria alternata]